MGQKRGEKNMNKAKKERQNEKRESRQIETRTGKGVVNK